MGLFANLFGKKKFDSIEEEKKFEGNFFTIARKGTLKQVLDALNDGANVLDKNDENCTPLMFAAEENNDPMVIKALIDAGAPLEAKTKGGATPIMGAAQKNSNIEVLQVLIDAGADVNKVNDIGFTPLIYATVYNNNPEFIKRLVNAGADVNFANKLGYSAFMYAVLNGRDVSILKTLVSLNAHPFQRDKNNMHALDHIEKQNPIENNEVYEYLLSLTSR